MTALLTGDIHFSADPRNAYRFKFVDWLCKQIERYDVRDLIILGDITDAKDEHGAEFVNDVVDSLSRLAKKCRVTIPTGNHDYVADSNPFFRFVRHIPNIVWINQISVCKFESIGDNCLVLPHTKDWKKEWPKWLKNRYDLVFTHCTFDGATGGFGHKLSGVDPKLFKKQSLVISGDIHGPQEFENILYVGAPYTINFGDNYTGRVLLVEDGQSQSMPVDIPQKRLCVADSLKDLREQQASLVVGDIVKIEYNLKRKDQEHWYDIKSEIQAWGQEHGFVIDAVVPLIDIQTKSYKNVDIQTDGELIEAYAKSTKASMKTLERGLYLADRA